MGTEAANKAFSAYVGLDKPEKKSKAKVKVEDESDAAGEATEPDRSDHPTE